jgi:glucosamine kinase
LRALQHAQRALDGRAVLDAFAQALLSAVQADNTEQLVAWLGTANQTAYAALAPLVFAHAAHPWAANLLARAGRDVAAMMAALDPDGSLPVALCGGLARAVTPYLPAASRARLSPPRGDAAQGALQLAAAALARTA